MKMLPATEIPPCHCRVYSPVKARDAFPSTPALDRAPGNLLLLQGGPVQLSAGGSSGRDPHGISFPGQATPGL
jgi:hypothetical protein